jgi:polygalacturonase
MRGITFVSLLSVICLVTSCSDVRRGERAFDETYNICDYGALGDGQTLNTQAINAAITACHEAGGGTVLVPPGVYLSGTIELLSNVTLQLQAGAVIKGSNDMAQYVLNGRTHAVESTWEQPEYLRYGLIAAHDACDVAITGRGTIDGNGDAFMAADVIHQSGNYEQKYTRQGENYMTRMPDGPISPKRDDEGRRIRPGSLVLFDKCTNVLVRDVAMTGSPNWALHIACCNDVTVTSVNMHHSLLIPNADGIDVSNCHNVHISDCDIVAGDDGIAMGGCADDFCGRSTENVTVSNCTIVSRSAGIRVGYADQDVRNCTFSNIVIHNSNRGLLVQVRGSQSIENILFDNIVIQTRLHTGWWGNGEPIHVSALRGRENPELGQIKNVTFSNIAADSEHGIVVYGVEESIMKDLVFDNVKVKISYSPLNDLYGGNFDLRSVYDTRYGIFEHDIPALYCRYADCLRIDDFSVEWADGLPEYFDHAIHCEYFSDLVIDGFRGRQPHLDDGRAAIALNDGTNVTIRNSKATEGTGIFASQENVDGAMFMVCNDLTNARQVFAPADNEFYTALNLIPNAE